MDAFAFFDTIHGWEHLTAFLIGMPRLFSLCLVAPFLGTGVLEGQVWLVLVLGLYLPVHPAVIAQITPETTLSLNIDLPLAGRLFCILVKESLIGIALGFLAGLPFWAVQSAGAFMDNQRGASQAEGPEILTSKSVTPMGGLLFDCLTYLLYTSGAFIAFLTIVYGSYELWPVTAPLPVPHPYSVPIFFASKVGWFMTLMMLISAPITVACLLVDISLGLINRFSPQLNAYVLAMPIKSGLAAFLLCLYLGLLLSYSPELFHFIEQNTLPLRNLLGVV